MRETGAEEKEVELVEYFLTTRRCPEAGKAGTEACGSRVAYTCCAWYAEPPSFRMNQRRDQHDVAFPRSSRAEGVGSGDTPEIEAAHVSCGDASLKEVSRDSQDQLQ